MFGFIFNNPKVIHKDFETHLNWVSPLDFEYISPEREWVYKTERRIVSRRARGFEVKAAFRCGGVVFFSVKGKRCKLFFARDFVPRLRYLAVVKPNILIELPNFEFLTFFLISIRTNPDILNDHRYFNVIASMSVSNYCFVCDEAPMCPVWEYVEGALCLTFFIALNSNMRMHQKCVVILDNNNNCSVECKEFERL